MTRCHVQRRCIQEPSRDREGTAQTVCHQATPPNRAAAVRKRRFTAVNNAKSLRCREPMDLLSSFSLHRCAFAPLHFCVRSTNRDRKRAALSKSTQLPCSRLDTKSVVPIAKELAGDGRDSRMAALVPTLGRSTNGVEQGQRDEYFLKHGKPRSA